MRNLSLVVSLPVRQEHVLEAARQSAPSLGRLLRLGDPLAEAEPSISGLCCQAVGVSRQQDWPVAPLTARADGLQAGNAFWLRLDPAYLEVGMGGLMLRPAEELGLAPDEAAALAADLRRLGLDLRAPVPTRWYLSLPAAPRMATVPLDRVAGEYLSAHLPSGPDASRLMSLVNEAQMVLHEHPVNLAREGRGQAPVNGLWLWGGGVLPTLAPSPVRVATDDAEVRALARAAGLEPPSALAGLHGACGPGGGDWFATLAPDARDEDLRDCLARLEKGWFQPALGWLRLGRLRRLHLHLLARPGQAVVLDSLGAWRLWR